VTVLAWIAVYLAAGPVVAALLCAAIRRGEQQARREHAQLAQTPR
jgi:hypothetical protein